MKKICILLVAVLLCSLLPVFTLAEVESFCLGVNALNTSAIAEGHSLVWTSKMGSQIGTDKNAFAWWKTATFEYYDDIGAYIVTSLSTFVSGETPKNNYIPENGFVLMVNTGNDYGSINYKNDLATDTYNNLDRINVGDRAYVTGMDLTNNTIEKSDVPHYSPDFYSNARIYIGEYPVGVEVYTPDTSVPRLSAPVLKLENGMVNGENDFTVEWEAVEGATSYKVFVNESNAVSDGSLLVYNTEISETSYTIPAEKLNIGYDYTISVCAVADGFRTSNYTKKTVFTVSNTALDSPFVNKRIVAFGDSVTAFTGWVKMLSGEIGSLIINAGYPGDTTALAVARLQDDVLAKEPDIVIVMFGINDQAVNMSNNQPLVSKLSYRRYYRTIIEKCRDAGADVILMTGHSICTDTGYYVAGQYNLNYGTSLLSDYYDVIRSLADEYKLNLIDLDTAFAGEKMSSICAKGDGIHLSEYGQKKYTEEIKKYLLNSYEEGKGMEESSDPESLDPSEQDASEPLSETVSDERSVQPIPSVPSIGDVTSSDNENNRTTEMTIVAVLAVAVLGGVGYFAFRKRK